MMIPSVDKSGKNKWKNRIERLELNEADPASASNLNSDKPHRSNHFVQIWTKPDQIGPVRQSLEKSCFVNADYVRHGVTLGVPLHVR
jgi:hypothetical protein